MKRIIGSSAVLALLVAAAASLIDLSGVVVGPFLVLALGAGVSWWAAHLAAAQTSDRATFAGMLAGAAVGVGALAGVLLLAVAAWIIDTVPVPQLAMTMTHLAVRGGMRIGMLLALTDCLFAVSGALFALLWYQHKHPMNHAPH